MSRSTSQDLFDRLRLAISTLLGRTVKPVPAYATIRDRRLPRRPTHLGR